MCIGVPLQVQSVLSSGAALCRGRSEKTGAAGRPVDTVLLETAVMPGDWLLVHVDVAIRTLEASEARAIADALEAVAAAAAGEPWEHLLADLIDREPQLPEHLRADTAGAADHG